MKSAAIVLAIFALQMGSAAFAEDVNRTGQPQTQKGNAAGTGSHGGDANTMGGATTERTEPSNTPQQPPQTEAQPDKGPKTNTAPDSANPQKD